MERLGEHVQTEIAREIARQEAAYGAFEVESAGGVRFALAVLGDEMDEALEAWREWRARPDWLGVRQEILQLAAIAHRILRDIPVELVD